MAGIDSLNGYVRDLKTKRAVERSLAVVGEAVGKLLKMGPDPGLEHARSIVGMRNRLIHSYDNIDDKIVWEVLRTDLPVLKAAAQAHLH